MQASDGSFRPNNNLNRNDNPQKTYGRYPDRRHDQNWLSHVASHMPFSWRRSSADSNSSPSTQRPNKRQKLSPGSPIIDPSREDSESPKNVARLVDLERPDHGSRHTESNRSPSIQAHPRSSMEIVGEYRALDDMMRPPGTKRVWSRSQSQDHLAPYGSSPDELNTPRNLPAPRTKTTIATRSVPLELTATQAPSRGSAVGSNASQGSAKSAAPVAVDEIEDSEPDRRLQGNSKHLEPYPLGQESHTEADHEDELLQDHARPQSPSKRDVTSKLSGERSPQERQARSPASWIAESSPDQDNTFKPAVFVGKRQEARQVESRRQNIEIFATQKLNTFTTGELSDLRLRYNKNTKQLDAIHGQGRKQIQLQDVANRIESQDACAVLLIGRHHEGQKQYFCYAEFLNEETLKRFTDMMERDFRDIRKKLESATHIHKTLERHRNGSANQASSGPSRLSQRRNRDGKLISQLQNEPGSTDRVGRRTRSRRDDFEDIKYEIEDSPPPNPIRKTRTGTGAIRPPKSSVSPQPAKFSETVGLGKKWDGPLLFPRSGAGRASVDYDDLLRLDEGDMLNDQLIYFCLRYAQLKNMESAKRVYIFNSFFFDSMSKGATGKKINYEQVKNWTRRVNIFKDYDYVVIPINEHLHWYAVIICNTAQMRPDGEDCIKNPSSPSDTGKPESGTPNVDDDDQSSSTDASISRHTADISFEDAPANIPGSSAVVKVSSGRDDGENEKGSANLPSRAGRPPPKRDAREPCILYLDSLKTPHGQTTTRLKAYLEAEAKSKQGWDSIKIFQAGVNERTIPAQNNVSDCGVYLVGYIAKFLKDPAKFVYDQSQGLLGEDAEWARLNPSVMRDNIRSMIQHEHQVMDIEKSADTQNSPNQVPRAHPPVFDAAYDEFTATKVKLNSKPVVKSPPVTIPDDPPAQVDTEHVRKAREAKFLTSPIRPSDSEVSTVSRFFKPQADSAPTTPLPNPTASKKDSKPKKRLLMHLNDAISSSHGPPSDDTESHLKRKASADPEEPHLLRGAPHKKQMATDSHPRQSDRGSLSPHGTSERKSSEHVRTRTDAQIVQTAQQSMREIERTPTRYRSPRTRSSVPPSSSPPIIIEDSQEPSSQPARPSSSALRNKAIIELDEDMLGDSRKPSA